ncbi:MAG: hypothetical protein WAL64_11525 [Candidatus Dormiibacterota bacterium]
MSTDSGIPREPCWSRENAGGLAPLIRLEESDLFSGMDLLDDLCQLSQFDAVLAATARRRSWKLASADRALADLPGLARLAPDRPPSLRRPGSWLGALLSDLPAQ